jgi:hypothetical protein
MSRVCGIHWIMKKVTTKVLRLDRQIVRNLGEAELLGVAAGANAKSGKAENTCIPGMDTCVSYVRQ